MPTTTTNYGLYKPLVGDPTDQDLWGGYLNTDMDDIDGLTATAIKWTPSVKSANFSITAPTAGSVTTGSSKTLFRCDASGGAIAASLPSASSAGAGFAVAFKKTDVSINAVTITANGSDKIDGAPTFALTAQYDWIVIVADGSSKWDIISEVVSIPAPVPSVAYGSIFGFTPSSVAGTSTTASLTIAIGQAADSTNAAYISKATTTSWAVSNGNAINGYSGGTTLPNSATIHFFMCYGGSGTGAFASNSLTPTFPAGYDTYKRRIFSLNTNSSGALLPGSAVEVDGGALVYFLATPILDVSTSTLGTSRTLYGLSVPNGIKVQPFFRAVTGGATLGDKNIIVTSGDESDIAPPTFSYIDNFTDLWSAAPGGDFGNYSDGTAGRSTNGMTTGMVITNTSAQIGMRSGVANTNAYLVTRGFKDFRRS